MEIKKIKSVMHRGPSTGQVFQEPSLTQPGMAMSIAEMFVKFQQGVKMDADGRLIWLDEENGEPLPRFNDLTDMDEAKEYTQSVFKKAKKAPERRQMNEQTNKKENEIQANEAKRKEPKSEFSNEESSE